MEIDIRNKCLKEEIDSVRFYDVNLQKDVADRLSKGRMEGLFIEDSDAKGCVFIETKEHALNLIKALEKAIDLGWFE